MDEMGNGDHRIAEYYTKVIGYNIPPMTPLVGRSSTLRGDPCRRLAEG